MRLTSAGRPHLSYCTNIHAGESLPEVLENLRRHVVEVKRRVAPAERFGVGLRLSAAAAEALAAGEQLARLRAWLEAEGLYVFTINGFPYGAFHATRVKEQVYVPDWREDRRRDYSDLLARLLAGLVPEGVEGSVSTVPGAFKPRVDSPEAAAQIADQLLRHVATLHAIFVQTGRRISLGLEPEPCCQLETIAETIHFFGEQLFSAAAVARFSSLTGLAPAPAEAFLRHHLGVCFDACHMSVEFEDMRGALDALKAAGIRVVKVQISAGLKVAFDGDFAPVRAALEPFADPVYLHQVVERSALGLRRFADLDQAFAQAAGATGPREWRVHFHVPLFIEDYGRLQNTQADLRALLAILQREAHTEHLEVETYTWDVLPPRYRQDPIAVSVARELQWVKEQLQP